ncbi:MAG TPA: amidohydrolase family protein, partial [Chitinophagaceae bacterium]|nr:amidohydrolase family protein [Chitinophagaceae bacterium]
MTIDSHVHFWKYSRAKDSWITNDMKILQQDYLPQSLIPTLRRNGIDGCVAVHANQSELETHFLVELSKTHDIIKGVVGWIDLRSDGVEDRLQYFSQYPIIKGWRHIVQSEADDFLLGDKFQRGISALRHYNYTYDLLIYPRQLGVALDFLAKFPDQAFIIDHCAKPDIKNKRFEEWKNQIQEIAR